MVVFAVSYVLGSSLVINWEVENIIDPVQASFQKYRLGIFEFPINIETFVISQSYIASELQVNLWPAYLLLIWLGVFLSMMLALTTNLTRFWFVIGIILFTVILVGLKLDYLVLFNSYNKYGLLVAFGLYFPPLYIFHFVKKDTAFPIKFIMLIVSTSLFATIIYFFSGVDLPFLHLANYGIYVPLILIILFAFIIGHEIISGLLRVITSGALMGEKNSLVHFLVIGVIFLVNAVLVMLRNTSRLDLDIYLIGSFWLLTIGAIVGIWGYRTKEVSYEGIFPFYPFGAFLFIGLAITSYFTISYFFFTGNDAFVEVAEDAIVYSQLGYSSMFIIYIIANFFDLIKNNVNVGKVIYQPRRMPYFISRFAAVIVIMGLFFRFNMVQYNHAVAGFYSGVGDLYMEANDYLSATEYYNISNIYSSTGHRANYAMATMKKREGKQDEEIDYLKQAIGKNPTPFAFVNLASRYLEKKRYFEAIFTLEDGLNAFPGNGEIQNNLGLAFLELSNIDSAFLFLNSAQQEKGDFKEPSTNIYSLLVKEDLSIKRDTLDYLLMTSDNLSSTNNLLVLANQLKKKSQDKGTLDFGEPENASIDQLVYNYNKSLNDPWLVDSVYLSKMKTFYDSSDASWFMDNLKFASALALYQQGEVSQSFELLNLLAVQNPEKMYYGLLGKLSLSQKAIGLAIDYFKNAFQHGNLEIAPELAFAYMENGDLEKASFIWKQIELRGDSVSLKTAKDMLKVIDTSSLDEVLLEDAEIRFSFLNYRYRHADLSQLEGLVLSFDSEDIQAMGFMKLFSVYLELGNHEDALRLLEEVGNINISRPDLLEEINLAQCMFAYHTQDDALMQRLLSNLKSNNLHVNNYLNLFESMEKSDSQGAARERTAFMNMGYKNPFFEDGVLESVRFFNDEIKEEDVAYAILLNAVNINPFSLKLNQAYAIQCLKTGLVSYAQETLEELKTMMPTVTYRTFEEKFQQTLQQFESNSSDW